MSDPTAVTGRPQPAVEEIHVCGACLSPFVQPVDWEQPAAGFWQIELRCPECEWHGTGVFTDAESIAFTDEIERGTESLLRDLRALAEANVDAEVERFAAALASDLITPEDFSCAS